MNVLFSAGQCFLSKLYNYSTCSPVQGRQGNVCDNQQHNCNQYHCSRNGVIYVEGLHVFYWMTCRFGTTARFNLSVLIVPVEMFSML